MSDNKKLKQQLKFKQTHRDKLMVFPPNIGDLVPSWHPARFVDELVENMDVSDILSTYKTGGTSVYHPKLLLKILFFGYLDRTYSSRDLEKACHEIIPYMWLCGDLRPDHVTICNFRSGKLKKKVKNLFAQVLKEIYNQGLIDLKNQTTDGTTIESVSNRYQYVWRKNTERYKGNLEDKIKMLLAEVDAFIEAETSEVKQTEKSEEPEVEKLAEPETSSNQQANSESQETKLTFRKLQDTLTDLKEVELENKKLQRKLDSKLNKLDKASEKLAEYEKQLEILGDRNSYSKTDFDATFMYTKENHNQQGQTKPAYNIQISGENEFVTNYTVHQNPNDAVNYISHTEDALAMFESVDLPGFETSNADSIYGTEQNYQYHKEKQITSYLQYPSYYAERTGKLAKKAFDSRNWYYNETDDFFVCVMGQHLYCSRTYVREKKNGFKSTIHVYEPLGNCATCPLAGSCLGKPKENSKTDPFTRKRSVHRNPNLEAHLKQVRKNLNSKEGKVFRKKRSAEIETHFAQSKGNRRWRRLTHRGLEKVEVEIGLHFLAQNIKKLYQKLWLGGISLLDWREYMVQKAIKNGKLGLKNSFLPFLKNNTLNRARQLVKKIMCWDTTETNTVLKYIYAKPF